MKTPLSSAPKKHQSTPDFSGRPKRVNLDQIVAVADFGPLNLRPIRLDDEKAMIEFHRCLSDESIYLRYFELLGLDRRTSHERLVRICTNTPDSYALVLETPTRKRGQATILAVGRLTKSSKPFSATFDTLIAGEAHTSKLAKIVLRRLIILARAFQFRTLNGELLVSDHDTINLCKNLGFRVKTVPEAALVEVSLKL